MGQILLFLFFFVQFLFQFFSLCVWEQGWSKNQINSHVHQKVYPTFRHFSKRGAFQTTLGKQNNVKFLKEYHHTVFSSNKKGRSIICD